MGYLTHGATAGGKTYDLLPCPHCGGEAEFRDGSSTKPYIRCKECGCRTWGSHAYDKLVAAWNRRAERTCRNASFDPLGFRCSECGAEDYMDGSAIVWVDGGPQDASYCPHCGARVAEEEA